MTAEVTREESYGRKRARLVEHASWLVEQVVVENSA